MKRTKRRAHAAASGASRRVERVAGEVQRLLASLLLRRTTDPRLNGVTITRVTVTGDLQQARVYFTVLSAEAGDVARALAGLASASAFLRRHLAHELDLRVTPELRFCFDEDLAEARRVDALLRAARGGEECAAAAREEGAPGRGGPEPRGRGDG